MKNRYCFFLVFVCCLYATTVSEGDEDKSKEKSPSVTVSVNVPSGSLPPSSLSTTLVSLKNVLIFVAIALVLVAGFLLYRYCRSARKKGIRTRYNRLKSHHGETELMTPGEERLSGDEEEETIFDKQPSH